MNGDIAKKLVIVGSLVAQTAALLVAALSPAANKAAIEEAVDKRFKEHEDNKTEE